MSRAEVPQAEDQFLPNASDPAVELKGSVFTLPVLRLHSPDLHAIESELQERLAQALRFFHHAPVVIDVEALGESAAALDLGALVALLQRNQLVAVGLRNAGDTLGKAAIAAGLAIMKGGPTQDLPNARMSAAARPAQRPERRVANVTARVVHLPVRSGQRVYAAGGDLIVLAPVNAGAEIIADGNIHVYAPLRGRALAGVQGDPEARIFCQALEAELVAVAGNFRVFEDQVPAELRGKPAQVYLHGEQLVVAAL